MDTTRRHAQIIGIGSYLPERILTNEDLEQMVETSDEWIVTRTGIKERHIAAPEEATSDLAAAAVSRALASADVTADEVDLLIVGTATPDHLMPSTACLVQARLEMSCPAFDINAACSGFIYALEIGAAAVESGRAGTVVVVGADTLSRVTDFTDRTTCVLFGDGAGAVVLRAADEPGVLSVVLGSNGADASKLMVDAAGTRYPCAGDHGKTAYIRMDGPEVFKFAVKVIPKATREALEASGHSVDDIDWLVPHQANQRILNTIEERLGVPHDAVVSNLEKTGNTSAASIPLALDDLYTSGRLTPGDLVALVGFGAGLTWGAAVVRWTLPVSEKEA